MGPQVHPSADGHFRAAVGQAIMAPDTARSMKLSTRYCATIRDRDTMQQVRVSTAELEAGLKDKLA